MWKKFFYVGKFLISQCKFLFIILLLCSILAELSTTSFNVVLGEMVNVLQGKAVSTRMPLCWFNTPLMITFLFVIIGLIQIIMKFGAGILDRIFQNILTQNLKSHLHDKIINLDAAYHQKHDQGENLFNINNAAGVICSISLIFVVTLSSLFGIFYAVYELILKLMNVSLESWLIFCIVPVLLIQPFLAYWLGNKINGAFAKLRANHIAVNEELLNSLKSPMEIQTMNASKQRSHAVFSVLQKVTRSSNRANILAILDNQFTSICILIFQALIAFVIVFSCMKGGKIDSNVAGPLVTCIVLIPQVFNQMATFIATYIQAKQSEPEITAVYDLLNLESAIKDSPDAKVYNASGADDICLQNVTFGYDEKKILNGLNVTFPAGKTVAIVSRSGGGKSTLLHLLSRLYDPEQGEVMLAGKNIREYTLESLRNSIIRVSQFPLFIQGSLRENFLLQNADATDSEIEDVCKKVGIWEIIKQQASDNEPIDFQLTLGAENLSGGQRRLLSIARAMLKTPPVMLLDEPTTGVDAQTTQDAIYPFLNEYKKKCSIIFIDHNMNFVRNLADMVLVIDNGTVADFGPTNEIWAKEDSLFRRLWEEYNKSKD